jgi:hypothetical protein
MTRKVAVCSVGAVVGGTDSPVGGLRFLVVVVVLRGGGLGVGVGLGRLDAVSGRRGVSVAEGGTSRGILAGSVREDWHTTGVPRRCTEARRAQQKTLSLCRDKIKNFVYARNRMWGFNVCTYNVMLTIAEPLRFNGQRVRASLIPGALARLDAIEPGGLDAIVFVELIAEDVRLAVLAEMKTLGWCYATDTLRSYPTAWG